MLVCSLKCFSEHFYVHMHGIHNIGRGEQNFKAEISLDLGLVSLIISLSTDMTKSKNSTHKKRNPLVTQCIRRSPTSMTKIKKHG